MTTLPLHTSAGDNVKRQASRRGRWDALRFLGFESSLKRVRFCGKDAIKGLGGVAVKVSGTGSERRGGIGQVQRCGSTWACPVCSHKIAASRAVEIAQAVQSWHKTGGRIVFLTLTMRHKRGQRLDDLWTNGVSAGWGKVTSGRGWVDDQNTYGTEVAREIKTGKRAGQIERKHRIGFARVVETTHGANGWHVHIHALLFVRGDISGSEALALGDRIFGRWLPALTDAGFGSPSLRHGVDVRLLGPGDSDKISEYFAKSVYGDGNAKKVGWEAAGGVNKTANRKFGNRTPFQILADAMETGDADDLGLWWQWEEASKGKRQLTWSPWLRAALALGVETSDEEEANKDTGGETVFTLRQDQYDAIYPVVPAFLDALEADDTLDAARAFLDDALGVWDSPKPIYSGPLLGV